jgi:hypothetical protein
MYRYAIILLLLFACEREAVIPLKQPDYLLGSWKQMDKYNFEWTFKPEGKFERIMFSNIGDIVQIMTGYYEHKNDSLYIVFRLQNNQLIEPPATTDYKMTKLEKEEMIWNINIHEIRFRKL